MMVQVNGVQVRWRFPPSPARQIRGYCFAQPDHRYPLIAWRHYGAQDSKNVKTPNLHVMSKTEFFGSWRLPYNLAAYMIQKFLCSHLRISNSEVVMSLVDRDHDLLESDPRSDWVSPLTLTLSHASFRYIIPQLDIRRYRSGHEKHNQGGRGLCARRYDIFLDR